MISAIVLSILKTVVSICFVLGSIALVHEFGHFITAKMAGIRVIEFSIGFSMGTGVRLIKFKYGETLYCVRPFPFGGFVQLAGMDPEEEAEAEAEEAAAAAADAAKRGETVPDAAAKPATGSEKAPAAAVAVDGSASVAPATPTAVTVGAEGDASSAEPLDPEGFAAKSTFWKVVVLGAGSTMNMVWAVVLFFMIFSWSGGPVSNIMVTAVNVGSPAQIGGVKPGDVITTIDGHVLEDYQEGVHWINQNGSRQITIKVVREHPVPHAGFSGGLLRGDYAVNPGTYVLTSREELSLQVTPKGDPGAGLIGIGLLPNNFDFRALGTGRALSRAAKATWGILDQTLLGFYRMIFSDREADVAGPIKIMQIIKDHAQKGMNDLLYLTAILSVNIGLINLFPLPVLDGSRIIFVLLDAFFVFLRSLTGIRLQINPRTEEGIHFVGLLLLLALMVLVTYKDIKSMF